ncbi:MAG: hypothetical protein AB4042_09055 [Leptolyngbyaceae cyanobacterium]
MIRRPTIALGIILGMAGLVGNAPPVQADIPLTHAEIQRLQNQVELIPDGSSPQPAQLEDQLVPGDALTTNQQALAELEFNDGTLARLGELALFYFQPESRTLDLESGTVLLLIPPEQGTSQLRTPNATAGIRGSGLFGRFIPGKTPDESVTLIGALTTSGIEVATRAPGAEDLDDGQPEMGAEEASDSVELEAGHIAVIVGDRPPQVFTFDLDIFYRTSTLVQGLALAGNDGETTSIWPPQPDSLGSGGDRTGNDPIELVRQETQDGLVAQAGTLNQPYVDNPFFVYRPWTLESTSAFSGQVSTLDSPTGADAAYGDTLDDVLEAADILTPEDIINLDSVVPDPVDIVPEVIEVLVPEPPVEPPMMLDPVAEPINDPFLPIAPLPDIPTPPVVDDLPIDLIDTPGMDAPILEPDIDLPDFEAPGEEVETPDPIEEVEIPDPVEEVGTPDPVEEVETPDPVEEIGTPNPIEEVETPDPVEEVETPDPVEEVETPDPVEEIGDPPTNPEEPPEELDNPFDRDDDGPPDNGVDDGEMLGPILTEPDQQL